MAKGTQAKQLVVNKIKEAFGENFVGEVDKKIYLWSQENGERVQVAISLTCPKTPIVIDNTVTTSGGDWDFTDEGSFSTAVAVSAAAPAEITEEEKANIAELMKKLGL
jgi:hypothetical protein